MLTAAPYSGDEDAYFRMLGLLHPDFAVPSTMSCDVQNFRASVFPE